MKINIGVEASNQLETYRASLQKQLGFAVSASDAISYVLKTAAGPAVVLELESDHRVRLDAEVARLMQDGQKIPAIKLVRFALNIGLKDAKDYAERFPYVQKPLKSFPGLT